MSPYLYSVRKFLPYPMWDVTSVHQGNSSVAWDSNIHYFRLRSEVYLEILGKIARGIKHFTEFQHNVPPTDGWTIRNSNLDYGRHSKELCD